jgi:hypothetical protein
MASDVAELRREVLVDEEDVHTRSRNVMTFPRSLSLAEGAPLIQP